MFRPFHLLSKRLVVACPGGADNICSHHGNCSDGVYGNGTCYSCDVSIMASTIHAVCLVQPPGVDTFSKLKKI